MACIYFLQLSDLRSHGFFYKEFFVYFILKIFITIYPPPPQTRFHLHPPFMTTIIMRIMNFYLRNILPNTSAIVLAENLSRIDLKVHFSILYKIFKYILARIL